MSRTAVLGGLVFVAVGLSGCASPARIIDSDKARVVVAIPDNTNVWPFYYQEAAKEAAAKSLGEPILCSSQRVKVGEQVTNSSDSSRREIGGQRPFGDVVTSTNTTSTSDKYEYHLEFRSIIPVRSTSTGPGMTTPTVPGGPAATLSAQGSGVGGVDGVKPAVIQPLLPVTNPTSPAGNMPSTGLTGPGR